MKANTLKYLPTKNHNFSLGHALPVYCQSQSCFLDIFSPHCFNFSLSFHTNFQLKPFFKSMYASFGPSQQHTKSPHSNSLHNHIQKRSFCNQIPIKTKFKAKLIQTMHYFQNPSLWPTWTLSNSCEITKNININTNRLEYDQNQRKKSQNPTL